MSDLEQLARVNQRLVAVLDTAVDAIITINEKGIVQSFNRAGERLFGYSAEEIIGQNISVLMPAPYREEHDSYLENYVRTGEKKIIGIGREVTARRKDGSEFPADLAVSAIRQDEEYLFTGFIRDITGRKQAEQALAEREAFLQAVFDTEPESVKVLGPGGIVLRVNRSGLKMLEADSLGEVHGQSFYPAVVEEHREALEQLIDRVFEGDSDTLEFEIIGRKGTRRRLETHAVPLRDGDQQIAAVLAITRDVTEHRLAEQRALQSERLAAIGQTVTGLAHESRNAFQRSQACLEMLAFELEGQEDALELVDRVQRALDHLHHLYEEVRDYAAPIKLDLQPCVLPHVWRDAWAHLEVARKQKEIEFGEEIPDGYEDCPCHCDWFAVGQVFRNLLENAIAACPDRGRIVVQMRQVELDGMAVQRIAIRDNGPGVPPEVQEKVFDAFYTTKSKGTGLGMAIAKRIVEAHGGSIRLGDTSQTGAEFVITLPTAEAFSRRDNP